LITVEIDLYSDLPSYVQLADLVRQGIADGTYGPRQPIPSLTSLQQQTGLSVNTIRKGIAILEDEGLVRTVPGRGTYVREDAEPRRE
jgi:DNA-binding GntR family transcriptional regulator